MDKIKQNFEADAKEYDDNIIKLIPFYPQILDALIGSLSYNNDYKIRVLDLGCGTGTISKRISEKFPNSDITCVDIASNMIEIAKFKLQNYPLKSFKIGDFSNISFDAKYDVVVSSLALHHLVDDNQKRDYYSTIYNILNDGGQFFNADIVLGSSTHLQTQNIDKWVEFMKQSVSEEEVKNKWIPRYHEEDKPAKLIDQLEWLQEIGFIDVDVVWKYYNFAVYGGSKIV